MPRPKSHATVDGGKDMFTLLGKREEERRNKIKGLGTIRQTAPHTHPQNGERKHVGTHLPASGGWRTIVDLRRFSQNFREIRQRKRDR